MLRGDVAEKAGSYDLAITEFRRAADMEDSLLYSEPPERFLQPRQYLGHAYLQAGKLQDAEGVYREDLERHRGNGWALRGLELTSRQQGRVGEADAVHRDFERAWKRSDLQLIASRF
jgi:tetratricopeptide (TPR) repeat protein